MNTPRLPLAYSVRDVLRITCSSGWRCIGSIAPEPDLQIIISFSLQLLLTSGQGYTTRNLLPLVSLRFQHGIHAVLPIRTGCKRCGSRHCQLQPTTSYLQVLSTCHLYPIDFQTRQSGGLPAATSHLRISDNVPKGVHVNGRFSASESNPPLKQQNS